MPAQKTSAIVNCISVKLKNGEKLKMPYWEINSRKDGPKLLVLAAQHGNEINGCEVIRQFVKSVGNRLKKGKIFAVPFANIPALRKRRPHMDLRPEQPYSSTKQNMADAWPGKKDGNNAERLCCAIYENIIKAGGVTHIVDIHCYSFPIAPIILLRTSHPENEEMAKIMDFPFALSIPEGEGFRKGMSSVFGRENIAAVGIELCGQYEVEAKEVKRGLLALRNVAKYLGMIAGKPEVRQKPIILNPKLNSKFSRHVLVRTKKGGLFVKANLLPGDYVKKGDYLGHVFSDVTLDSGAISAPVSGYLKMYGSFRENSDVSLSARHPYLDKGEPIAMIIRKESNHDF